MKNIIPAILILFLVFSCKEEVETIERHCKLTESEMIDVMVDFSLMKSAKSIARKELKDSGIRPYEYLFKKHGVDSIVIKENLKYYNLDLEKSKKLYDTVSKIIMIRSEKLEIFLENMEEEAENDTIVDDNEVEKNTLVKDSIVVEK